MNLSDANLLDSGATNITNSLPSASEPEDIQNLVNVLLQIAAVAIFTTIVSAIVFFVIFSISFPFQAVLLKYRVNYVPSAAIEADSVTSGSQSRDDSELKSYPRMFHRILQTENWGGLYKGVVPSFFSQAFVLSMYFLVVLGEGSNIERPPQSFQAQIGNKLFRMVFSLPLNIIINRAITTNQKLPWFNASRSLEALLSEAERRRPWLLYLTPGLFLIELVYETYSIVLARPLESVVYVDGGNETKFFSQRRLFRFCALLAYSILQTTVRCLYEVVFARLSVQRNEPPPRNGYEEKTETEKNSPILHIENRPYTGLVDCARRIAMEEGYAALFRGWWYDFVVRWWKLPLVLLNVLGGRA